MGKSKKKGPNYTLQLSSRRKVNINSFKGCPWIHINDKKTGNHVTLDKKDFRKLAKQSSKVLGYIKKVESKISKNKKSKNKKRGDSGSSSSGGGSSSNESSEEDSKEGDGESSS